MKRLYSMGIAITISLFFGSVLTGRAFAAWPTPVSLLTADSFAVIAGSTVTGPGIVTGNLGLSPGSSVTGFPPGVLNGILHVANPTAVQAQNDVLSAINSLASEIVTSTIPTELGGTTRNPGVYNSAAGTFGITGTVTLDALGDPNAVFIFKSTTTLITAGSSIVLLSNGAQACNVFWYVGSSATLGANSVFKGNILALTSATLITSANVEWRIFARNGAVTLDNNTVKRAICIALPSQATLNVIKTVVNGSGGTAVPSDFVLHVNQSGSDVLGSPYIGAASPWTPFVLSAGRYSIVENANASYSQSYSWDCSSTGSIALVAGDSKTCTITNTFVPPVVAPVVAPAGNSATNINPVANSGAAVLPTAVGVGVEVAPTTPVVLVKPRIGVRKTADRRLPFLYGGGDVTYTYLVTNPGTVALHSVELKDDKCAVISLDSGDVNDNFLLEPSETWSFSCRTNVRVSTTNLATANGTANGRIVYAYDTAVVIVRPAPEVPTPAPEVPTPAPVPVPVPKLPKTGVYDESEVSFPESFFRNLNRYLAGEWR